MHIFHEYKHLFSCNYHINNNDVIEVVIEEGHATHTRASVSLPAVTSGLTVDVPLVIARRACMVAELGGLATMTIQVGLKQLAQMASHLSTIVGVPHADGTARFGGSSC